MKKDWILTIGIDKYYLTEKQMKFYLDSIDKGAKYVAVSEDKMLGTNFQSLVNISAIEETKALEEGKWQCDAGRWHNKNAICYCNQKWISRDGFPVSVEDTYQLKPGEKHLDRDEDGWMKG